MILAFNFTRYLDVIVIYKGIGVDLGLKDFAICSTGVTKKNINKTKTVKKEEKKLIREQRKLSRKYESLKLRNKNKEGETTRQNIQKQIVEEFTIVECYTNCSSCR